MTVETTPQIEQIMQQLDHLIAEMVMLRGRVAALSDSTMSSQSIRQADYFGIWADHDEMAGKSSRVWLEEVRNQQWTRS